MRVLKAVAPRKGDERRRPCMEKNIKHAREEGETQKGRSAFFLCEQLIFSLSRLPDLDQFPSNKHARDEGEGTQKG
jgi:hypothetical protein